MINKNALSPLIAGVLLLVIVVGIGGVIAGIAKNFVNDQKATTDKQNEAMICSRDVAINAIIVDEVIQICKGTDFVYALIENAGHADINDFEIVISGTNGFFRNSSYNATHTFTKGEVFVLNTTFSGITASDIQQIKIVPKLKRSGRADYNYCFDAAYKFDGTPDDC